MAGMQVCRYVIGSIYMLTCEIEYVDVNVGKHVCAVLALCS